MSVRFRSAAAALVVAWGFALLPASAEEKPGAPAAAKPAAPGAAKTVCGRDLMTPEELAAHRQKLQSLKTDEERTAYATQHRAQMEARAKERGLELAPVGCGEGGGAAAGAGAGPKAPR